MEYMYQFMPAPMSRVISRAVVLFTVPEMVMVVEVPAAGLNMYELKAGLAVLIMLPP
jgi:hypothetical protein